MVHCCTVVILTSLGLFSRTTKPPKAKKPLSSLPCSWLGRFVAFSHHHFVNRAESDTGF